VDSAASASSLYTHAVLAQHDDARDFALLCVGRTRWAFHYRCILTAGERRCLRAGQAFPPCLLRAFLPSFSSILLSSPFRCCCYAPLPHTHLYYTFAFAACTPAPLLPAFHPNGMNDVGDAKAMRWRR